MRRANSGRAAAALAIGCFAGAAGLVGLAGLAAPTALAAEDEVLYGGDDWYGSVSGVLAVDTASDADGSKLAGGANVSAGFRFNRWITAEIGGEWIDDIEYDRGTGTDSCRGSGGESDRFWAWQVTAGSRVHVSESFIQPFALGHVGFIQTRDHGGGRSCTGNGFVARLGGGVDVFVTNGLAVSVIGAYVLPVVGGARDHDYVSIGFGITWY
jgi:hypothetical protein